MMSLENVVAIPLSGLEGGFEFTPWEPAAQFIPSPPQLQPVETQPRTVTGSASDEPTRDETRRIRRMISNRDSARRSRLRKQRHLEDLRNWADRLRSENREIANRLVTVTRHCRLFCRDNDRLRSEAALLRRRLADMRRVLIFRLASLPACAFTELTFPA